MGSSTSKPTQVWQGSSAPGISHDLAQALQSSPETDVSRLQALELEVQNRVAAELKRLRAEEAKAFQEQQKKLSVAAPTTEDELQGKPSSQTVSKEISALKAKLEERRKIRDLPDSVEAARGEVVRCLRENDRRPLDCWKEVEQFKEEVRRLEKGWVDKVIT